MIMDENSSTTKVNCVTMHMKIFLQGFGIVRHQFEVYVFPRLYNYMEFQDAFVLKVEHNTLVVSVSVGKVASEEELASK